MRSGLFSLFPCLLDGIFALLPLSLSLSLSIALTHSLTHSLTLTANGSFTAVTTNILLRTKEDLDQFMTDVCSKGLDPGKPKLIFGLHTCGDLGAAATFSFLHPAISKICLLGCCFTRITQHNYETQQEVCVCV